MSISLKDVVLTYPDGDERLRALDDVDFEVGCGEFVAVTGPSGSGKSSLLAVAGLLTTPDSGRVVIDGQDVTGQSRDQCTAVRREKLGFVFQQSNLLPSLTAVEQLQMMTHLAGGSVRDSRARRGPVVLARSREAARSASPPAVGRTAPACRDCAWADQRPLGVAGRRTDLSTRRGP